MSKTNAIVAMHVLWLLQGGPLPAQQAGLDAVWGDAPPPDGLAVVVGEGNLQPALDLAHEGRRLVLVLAGDEPAAQHIRLQLASSPHANLITVAAACSDAARRSDPSASDALAGTPRTLPLCDHMANVIVIDAAGAAALGDKEILRVLVPVRGRAYVKREGKWQVLSKPMPAGLDGWTHFFHGPDGNKVSRDSTLRMPNALRWIAGPRLQDNNGANGWRMDAGLAVSEWLYPLAPKENLSAVVEGRDAFNGVLLWQDVHALHRGEVRPLKTKPFILADGRLLRIHDDGKQSRIAAFDPLTGRLARAYASSLELRDSPYTALPPQFTYHDGRIYQASQKTLRCIDAAADRSLWDYQHEQGHALIRPVLAADRGMVILCEAIGKIPRKQTRLELDLFHGRYPAGITEALVAVDMATGKLRWRTPVPDEIKDFRLIEPKGEWEKKWGFDKRKFHAVAYRDGRVFCLQACDANQGNPSAVWALDAATGRSLWVSACGPVGHGRREMFDLFLLKDGTIFTYGHSWCRLDQATGKLLAFGNIGGNGRCDTGACSEHLVTAGFGNYFDLAGPQLRWTRSDLARGQCGGWGTPAYGMIFHHGSGCGCFFPVRGNLALHRAEDVTPIPDKQRLRKGPAIDRPLAGPAAADWPEYLFNGQRRAWSPAPGPRKLRELWRAPLARPIPPEATGPTRDQLVCGIYNGPLTAPIVADGLLFVADRDRGRLLALDAATGQARWTCQAGGRILTPPTFARGRVVFGTRDGYVHCLDARTGQAAWTFLAAPAQRYIVAYGRVESAWPVHGCLSVVGETVVASAGYHAESDGGIWAWGLHLADGSIRWSRRLHRSREWQTFQPRRTREGWDYLHVADEKHELASANQSNGQYNVTRARNIDMPLSDGRLVETAGVTLDPADGSLAKGQVADALVWHGERFPFLDMEFEDRGGPHGPGSWGTRLGDMLVGAERDAVLRVAHDGGRALVLMRTQDWKLGPGLFLVGPDAPKDRWNRCLLRELKPLAHSRKGVGKEADSLAVAGTLAYIAAEGHLMRPWGEKEQRPRERWRKGEAIPGHIELFELPVPNASANGARSVPLWESDASGAPKADLAPESARPVATQPTAVRLAEIQLDSAVINNGLAVAAGRLYAVCEDGSVRCMGE